MYEVTREFTAVFQCNVKIATAGLTFLPLKDRLQEEELGSLPVLSERNGSCVSARFRQSCSVNTGQEMLC